MTLSRVTLRSRPPEGAVLGRALSGVAGTTWPYFEDVTWALASKTGEQWREVVKVLVIKENC